MTGSSVRAIGGRVALGDALRRRPRLAVAPVLAVVSLASALTTVPGLVDHTVDPPAATQEGWDRPELYPGDIGIPAVVVERAEQLIREDELYAIAIGDQIPVVAGGIGIVQGLHYFLLPRGWTDDYTRADWVIAWGQSSETLGVPIAREYGVAPSVNLVEVRR